MQQDLRLEVLCELVAAGQQPAVGRVGGAGVEGEGGVARAAEPGREHRRERTRAPEFLRLHDDASLAVFAQVGRVGRGDRTQRPALEVVARVVAVGRTVAQVDAAQVDDLGRADVPTEIRLAQGVDAVVERVFAVPRHIEPVRHDGAQAGGDAGIEPNVERHPSAAELRVGTQQRAARSRRLAEEPPALRCLRNDRRLVGQRQRIGVVRCFGLRCLRVAGSRGGGGQCTQAQGGGEFAQGHSGLKRGR